MTITHILHKIMLHLRVKWIFVTTVCKPKGLIQHLVSHHFSHLLIRHIISAGSLLSELISYSELVSVTNNYHIFLMKLSHSLLAPDFIRTEDGWMDE